MNIKTSIEISKDISKPEQLITEHIDIWTSAILAKSTSGRGSSKKYELYGIGKLRALILELAVRGKLVPQNPDDEPASVLLEILHREQAQLIEEGKIRKSKTLPEIEKGESLFDLPQGWEFSRLQQVIDVRDGTHDSPKYDSGKNTFPLVTSKDFQDGAINFDTARRISEIDHIKISQRSSVDYEDILFSMIGGNIGNQVMVLDTRPFSIKNVALFKYYNKKITIPKFVKLYTGFIAYQLQNIARGGAQPFVSLGYLRALVFALPPVNEQHRIVAKVDELMLLCDQLEQQTETSIEAHATLVEVLLATLTDSSDSDDLAQNWSRIAEHFDSLFTTEQSIEALKQTVLQLAVMGKLVPQNPEDESASVLLEKIAEEKEQLIQDKKIKPRKALPPIENEEKLFDLPLGWEWCRLDDICDGITSGSTPPKSSFIDETGIPYLKVYNIRNQKIDFEYQPQFIEESYHSSSLKRSQLCPGDVIMNIVGPPLGKIAIIPDTYPQWNCNQAIVMFRPFISDLNKFIYTYLVSGMFLDKIALIGTAGQDNISVTKSRAILLPTPPLAEQLRIVAKIDELMAICDQLKEKIRQSQETQVQLTDALVDQALG